MAALRLCPAALDELRIVLRHMVLTHAMDYWRRLTPLEREYDPYRSVLRLIEEFDLRDLRDLDQVAREQEREVPTADRAGGQQSSR